MKKSPVWPANRMLAFCFITIALYSLHLLFLNFAIQNQSYFLLSHYYRPDILIGMLIAPLCYVYVQKLINTNQYRNIIPLWLHVLPVALVFIFVIAFAKLSPQKRVDRLLANYMAYKLPEMVLLIVFYLQLLFYNIVSLFLIRNYRAKAFDVNVQDYTLNIKWLYHLLQVQLLVSLVLIPINLYLSSDAIYIISGMLMIDILFFYILISSLWSTGLVMHSVKYVPIEKGHSLHFSDDEISNSIKILFKVMDQHKIYLSSNCKLPDVAAITHISVHRLSYILNTELSTKFSDFINKYRIVYACKLLKEDKKQYYTFEAIGKESGFGSRSNFNRAFKKNTQYTPNEYCKLVLGREN